MELSTLKIINKLKQSLFRDKQLWPRPTYLRGDEPHFIFLLTPSYSGSTAIAKLLQTSPHIGSLHNKAEGQWLIPGLKKGDRWEQNKFVDYKSVKTVWLAKYQQIKKERPLCEYIIEKSPPNMMRINELAKQFKSYSLVANNRNPYANCASMLFRNHDVVNLDQQAREKIISNLVDLWVIRSNQIKMLVVNQTIPLLTYEDFCGEPELLIDNLQISEKIKNTINTKQCVQVKDYLPQPIKNQNERQISLLKESDIQLITKQLNNHDDLLKFFGYQFI